MLAEVVLQEEACHRGGWHSTTKRAIPITSVDATSGMKVRKVGSSDGIAACCFLAKTTLQRQVYYCRKSSRGRTPSTGPEAPDVKGGNGRQPCQASCRLPWNSRPRALRFGQVAWCGRGRTSKPSKPAWSSNAILSLTNRLAHVPGGSMTHAASAQTARKLHN